MTGTGHPVTTINSPVYNILCRKVGGTLLCTFVTLHLPSKYGTVLPTAFTWPHHILWLHFSSSSEETSILLTDWRCQIIRVHRALLRVSSPPPLVIIIYRLPMQCRFVSFFARKTSMSPRYRNLPVNSLVKTACRLKPSIPSIWTSALTWNSSSKLLYSALLTTSLLSRVLRSIDWKPTSCWRPRCSNKNSYSRTFTKESLENLASTYLIQTPRWDLEAFSSTITLPFVVTAYPRFLRTTRSSPSIMCSPPFVPRPCCYN